MSTLFTNVGIFISRISKRIDSLVDPLGETVDHARHERLLKILLVAPFFFSATMIIVFMGQLPAGLLLSVVCAIFALPWLTAGLILSTANFRAGEWAALVFGSLALAGVIGGAGGMATPLLILVLAIPAETTWIVRRAPALAAGLVASIAVAVAQLAIPPVASAVDAAHWVIPFVYLATLAWRAHPHLAKLHEYASGHGEARDNIVDVMNAVTVFLGKGDAVESIAGNARRLLNVDDSYLLDEGLFDRIHVSDRVAYMTAISDIREGAALKSIALRLRIPAIEPDASDRFEEFSCEFVRIDTGKKQIAAILRANTEAQALRRQLRETGDRAAATEIAKSRFLATVSHELRTPLNAIIGFSDILLHEMYGKFSDERQREYVDLIRQSGNHLLSVVNAVLDVSKIESGNYAIRPDAFDFRTAANMCCQMLEHQAKAKDIRLREEIPEALGHIIADARAVQQILINLVSNAIKFTPEGGSVTISARRHGDFLSFDISDTGIGIEHGDLERLGNPFVQVQNDYTRNFEGTGLGLSLVKGLVELHEGTLTMDSEPGAGTIVTVKLPVNGPQITGEAEEAEKDGSLAAAEAGEDEDFDVDSRLTA